MRAALRAAGWLMVMGMLSVWRLLYACAEGIEVGGEPLATELSDAVT
jgi:hypothetical protein